MRLDINLATRPYEDAREFWQRWGLGVGLLGVLTLALLAVAARGWTHAGRDRQNIAQLQQRIAERDREREQDQAILDLAANRSTRDESQFLNGLIQIGRDRQNIAQLQQRIAERDREREQDQAILDLAANRSTRDESQFLNGLIQRKAFSWTRVFEDLE